MACGFGQVLLHYERSLRIWWNWQTRYFEVVVGQPVQVQVLLCAPFGNLTRFRRAETTV